MSAFESILDACGEHDSHYCVRQLADYLFRTGSQYLLGPRVTGVAARKVSTSTFAGGKMRQTYLAYFWSLKGRASCPRRHNHRGRENLRYFLGLFGFCCGCLGTGRHAKASI